MVGKDDAGEAVSSNGASLTDWGVDISYYGVPCACRCRHCCLGGGPWAPASLRYERAKRIANRFLQWAGTGAGVGFRVEFGVGFSYNLETPQLLDYVGFRRAHDMAGWDYLPLNGLRLKGRDELCQLLTALADAGIRLVNLSFYGLGKTHDEWARRRGDFAYLMRMAEVAAECGLSRSETIFPRKSVLAQLPRLVEMLDPVPGLEQRILDPWDFRGRGKELEEERPELSDLDMLPALLRSLVNFTRYRTEAAWIEAILAGQAPPRTRRIYDVCVGDDNVDYLEREECAAILSDIRDRDDLHRKGEPSLPELANRFGDRSNLRLYAMRDLEWKWLGQYYGERGMDALPDWFHPLRSKVILG